MSQRLNTNITIRPISMNLLYNIGISAYGLAVKVASVFVGKAKLWVQGRHNWEERLAQALGTQNDWLWMHCSSLGEFEQGRPLLEAIKAQNPLQKILLTFFSPSGYEVRKNYAFADHVCYLPLDTPRNARVFLDIVQPRLIIHVKYDLWLNLIAESHRRKIPQLLVSVLVRPDSRFLKSLLRRQYKLAFQSFSWIFTQDLESLRLLESFCEMERISAVGDTRFDRVAELPGKFELVPGIAEWINGRRCIVVGSTWPQDETIVLPTIAHMRAPDLCWIIAPHEIHGSHIDHHIHQGHGKMQKYSALSSATITTDVLWIDNVGMLSRLYHYSALVYIGGGFGVGIHNTQEPAVYGNPVIFGPNYHKFQEAVDLVAAGGARSVSSASELEAALRHWLDDAAHLSHTRAANEQYMQAHTGATAAILKKLHVMGNLAMGGGPT
jgi:3-deoxy-D-manno-octulosonic-acid transferase